MSGGVVTTGGGSLEAARTFKGIAWLHQAAEDELRNGPGHGTGILQVGE